MNLPEIRQQLIELRDAEIDRTPPELDAEAHRRYMERMDVYYGAISILWWWESAASEDAAVAAFMADLDEWTS